MPNKDGRGPDGKGRTGKGLGPCSSRRANKRNESNYNNSSCGFKKRRGNK